MTQYTVGFLGLGLIGGSIARALKENLPETRIVAFDPDKDAISQAYKDGVVDVVSSGIDAQFSGCDFIFLCAGVESNVTNAGKVAAYLGENTILTDISSVKTPIHQKINDLGLENKFIGGHPMAGSERSGYANSKAKLLENAYYIITQTESNTPEQVSAYRDLVDAMGAIPIVMSPEQHDFVTAAVSHVPHVISASLVNLVQRSDGPNEEMKMIAAGGFKDITRISSSSAAMWQQICLSNSENVCSLLEDYVDLINGMKNSIKAHDPDMLFKSFDSARRYRESFIDTSSGPIKTSNAIHIEIPDEPGALAIVTTILASNSINIKNVGIIHNREFETGSLRVELHDETDVKHATNILEGHGYQVNIG